MINPNDGKTVEVDQGHLELEITQIDNKRTDAVTYSLVDWISVLF